MAKYEDIARTLKQRIRHGDYRLRGFPSHAGLVAELGVNSRTVTRALSALVKQGMLVRRETGRFDLPAERATLHVGMLAPAYPSPEIARWHQQIDEGCAGRGWSFKAVPYTHWDDAAIVEAMRGLDGLFFLPTGDDFPEALLNQIKTAETPAVLLEEDASSYGIPCLRSANPASIQLLIEHLREQGHRRVACLNTQPLNNIIRARIEAWHLWASALGIEGPVINEPVNLFNSATRQAHTVVARRIEQDGGLDATGIVCTTGAAAVGAMRALTDAGLTPGEDVAVCSAEDWAGAARYLTPSLTCLEYGSIRPLVQACLDYIERAGREWLGPLLVEPAAMKLYIGESTTGRRAE